MLTQDEETAISTEPPPHPPTPLLQEADQTSQCGLSGMCNGAGLALPPSKPLTSTTSV